jgi:hypothetical protein
MINNTIKFTIFHDDNGTFFDYSNQLVDYYRDTATMALNKDDDYLYIGHYKPFRFIYFELQTPNINANSFVCEYYNGTAWTALTIIDSSNGFTRSGYLQFDKPEYWGLITINSIEKYYIRVRPSATHSSTVLLGANIIYADDIELKSKYFNIYDFLGARTSFINECVTARDHIIQTFRNKNLIIDNLEEDASTFLLNNLVYKRALNALDLHEIEEVKLAATYLALGIIFRNASDDPEGNLMAKATYYEGEARDILNKLLLSYDKNDDGLVEDEERANKISSGRTIR